MAKWGKILLFFGVGSMVLSLAGLEFRILAWIDMWGTTVGWAIRIALALAGALMWLGGRAASSKPENA